MSNEEKLKVLENFLKENNIVFKKDIYCKGQHLHIFIPEHKICVRISDRYDQLFYYKIRRKMHPLFIRSNETPEFIVEKMQNLIIDLMQKKQKEFEKKGVEK